MHFDAFHNSPFFEKASEEMGGGRVPSDGRDEDVTSGRRKALRLRRRREAGQEAAAFNKRPIVRFWSAISTLIGAAASPRGIESQPPVAQRAEGGRQPLFKPYI